jgi:hypothetical protein
MTMPCKPRNIIYQQPAGVGDFLAGLLVIGLVMGWLIILPVTGLLYLLGALT